LSLFTHPVLHSVFEALAYAAGFAFYRRARRKQGDALAEQQRLVVIAAAAAGALLGSRILGVLEQAPRLPIHWQIFFQPGGGKTIVGGLLGGWILVEIVKKLLGIRSRTGDLFAIPLCIGIAVGRIGCFLGGLADDTYGKATTLPWGVDFGDGIRRHPTQIYEILFLLALAFALHTLAKHPHRTGALFRIFMAAYLSWRLLIDFIKPQPLLQGMNLIQWACAAGLLWLGLSSLLERRNEEKMLSPEVTTHG
jgi:phosphatidylglycerol---prolipoprotein diacylglyceryl transferase